MGPVTLSVADVATIKNFLRTIYPDVKSSHRVEALARGFGFRTNASLIAALEERPISVVADETAFDTYLAAHGFARGRFGLGDALAHVILARVMTAIPELSANGLGRIDPYDRRRAREEQQAEFDKSRLDLLSPYSAEAFRSAYAFASTLVPRQTFTKGRSSYGLKHVAEAYARSHPELGLAPYMANGVFIAAMHQLGFKWRRIGSTPNAEYAIAVARGGQLKTTRPRYRGVQWKVTPLGVESNDETYFFEGDRLDERRPGTDLYDWLPHMAEKPWVDLDDFARAFENALDVHLPAARDADRLARSIAEARRIRTELGLPMHGTGSYAERVSLAAE